MTAAEMFAHWQIVRDGLIQALDLVGEDGLDFIPGEGLWSCGQTATHIVNAEEGWFRHVVRGDLDKWPEWPGLEPFSFQALKARLAAVHGATMAYLDTLDQADLEQRIRTSWGTDLSLAWVIWHVLEHEIHHRGEIFLMLGLMGLKAPDI